MKKLLILFLLSGPNSLNSTYAQTAGDSLSSFIEGAVNDVYNKEPIPGVFVAVLNNGKRNFFNAGSAIPDKQIPFDSSTVFEIGSITKTFTAYILTAVLLEKKIADTELVITYLPDSVQENENLRNISFASLLNHTSGLPRIPDNMKPANGMQPYEDYSATELFTFLKRCTPKPDGKSNYSNLGAGLAGVLASSISGRSYEQLIDQYIKLPAAKSPLNKSQGYFAPDKKSDYWKMNVLAPCGGLQYSGSQMLTYLQQMCFPETAEAKEIISKLTNQTIAINPQVAVGLGWHILNIKNQEPVYWHNGGTYGFSTFCAFSKDKSKAVLVVINQFNKNEYSDGLGFTIFKKMLSEE